MTSTTNSIRYFAYVRKSTEGKERQALSIDSQKHQINQLFPGLDIVEIIEERRSAFLPYNRPAFAKMIKRIKQGEAQGIVSWHPDRLSRNEIDGATLTYMIRKGQIQDLKFGSYHFHNSPEGIMMLQLALSQSQYSSAKLSKDVKRGLEQKAKMGWLPSRAPSGYLNNTDTQIGIQIVVKDPLRFPLIRKMWNLMLTGNYTPLQILEIANNEWGYRNVSRKTLGGERLSRSGIYQIFNNSFYYGWFEFPEGSGKWYQGKHNPMITEEEFERVHALLGRKRKPTRQKRVFSFRGLIQCGECGYQITAEEKNQVICTKCKQKFSYVNRDSCSRCTTPIEQMINPTFLHYVYYRCSKKQPDVQCRQGYVEVKQLERQIDQYLKKIHINQKYLDWSIKYLKKVHKQESSSRQAVVKSQQAAYKNITGKLDKLLEMRMGEEISEEEYRNKKSEFLKKRTQLKENLENECQRQDKWLKLAERAFNFARYARFWFAEGDLQQKREILATLGSNLILKGRKLTLHAAKPFFIIQKGLAAIPEAKAGFEPNKNRMNKGKTGSLDPINPRWQGVVDSTRTYWRKTALSSVGHIYRTYQPS